MDIAFEPNPDLTQLERRWRALHSQSAGGFFRGWDFIGCQAAQRFTAPTLFSLRAQGQDLALGLLNRAQGRLHLHSTGDAAQDAVYIEHNGLLVRAGAEACLAPALAALAARGPIIMPGMDDAHLHAAQAAGLVTSLATQFAPAVALDRLTSPYLDLLSANTRAQIRRAMRLHPEPPKLHAAADTAQALDWFGRMVALHQASWQARGKPGAFASATMLDFHRALLRRAVPQGGATLLRVTAGTTELGYLYLLLGGGTAHAYQSGFAPPVSPQDKPGLICHALAIEHLRAQGVPDGVTQGLTQGLTTYDFMAKADRYKLSLAPQGGQNLHWFTLYPAGSPRGRLKLAAQSVKSGLRAALARRQPQA